jgi:hypothetical protein
MDDAVSLTSKRFRFERDSILSGLDYAALAAGYLVTAADMFPTEVPAGAIGGAGTLWIRRSKRSDTIIMKFMNTRKPAPHLARRSDRRSDPRRHLGEIQEISPP